MGEAGTGGGSALIHCFKGSAGLLMYSTASPGGHLLFRFPEGKAEAQRGGQGLQVYPAQENAGPPHFLGPEV